jgi:amidase
MEELRKVGAELGMSFSDDELAQHRACLEGGIAAYNLVDQMTDELPAVAWPRTPGHRPAGADNPYNAWYVKTEIQGAPTGKLKGKKVAIKDNICVAGVPMMNGASTLEGYVPEVDATVVTRILDAGGTIVGKTVCEYFCFSGGSHTSSTGPVHNPHRHGYSAGGSSSGSAAVVAAGEVPMALGGDQGGSIRMPASFCGIYGMKPTHGLVPYTGIMPIELTIDHTGPMTATVEDNALLLEVLAARTGSTPADSTRRQSKPYPRRHGPRRGRAADRGGARKGSAGAQCMEKSDARECEAARALQGLGAVVEEVSIPMHLLGPAIWLPVAGRGRDRADDAWQRLRLQLAGPVCQLAARRAQQLARPGRRAVRDAEEHHAARPLHGDQAPRPLLRQGAEPGAAPARGLRFRAGAVRPAGHADAADGRDTAAAGHGLHHGDHPARL